jgi:hypothetical protein
MKKNLNEQVSRIKDMMKKINESPEFDEPSSVESDEKKYYWQKWDEDPEGDDESVEDMKLLVRSAVERGKISDTEGYEIEDILDNDLERFAEYDSGGSGWFDKSEKSIDYKQTIGNIRKYLNNR